MIKVPISDYFFEFDKQKSLFQNRNIIRIYTPENILIYELSFSDDEYEMFGNILLLIYYEIDKVDDPEFIEDSDIFLETMEQFASSVMKTDISYNRDINNVLESLEDTIYGFYEYSFNLLGNSSNLDSYRIRIEFHINPVTFSIYHYDKFGNILNYININIPIGEVFIMADIILGLTE